MADLKLKEGIMRSIKLVKKEYPATLMMSVILFVAFYISKNIPGKIGEILEFTVILPFFVIILTRFVMVFEKSQ